MVCVRVRTDLTHSRRRPSPDWSGRVIPPLLGHAGSNNQLVGSASGIMNHVHLLRRAKERSIERIQHRRTPHVSDTSLGQSAIFVTTECLQQACSIRNGERSSRRSLPRFVRSFLDFAPPMTTHVRERYP